jgi:septum formation topological specificity factor MinE
LPLLGSQIDLFNVLREEILAVVSRHVSVAPIRDHERWRGEIIGPHQRVDAAI